MERERKPLSIAMFLLVTSQPPEDISKPIVIQVDQDYGSQTEQDINVGRSLVMKQGCVKGRERNE